MSGRLLIRGGRLLDPQAGIDAPGDLLVVDGRVAAAVGFETAQPLYELRGLPTLGKPAPRAIIPPQARSLPAPSRFAYFEN